MVILEKQLNTASAFFIRSFMEPCWWNEYEGPYHWGHSLNLFFFMLQDEFHSRLRFNRRGLVAMANAGPHDNGSQFFFTLGRADELNNKHTIFGKVCVHYIRLLGYIWSTYLWAAFLNYSLGYLFIFKNDRLYSCYNELWIFVCVSNKTLVVTSNFIFLKSY